MSIEGVDYSARSVNPAVLAEQGKQFAGRYLGPGSADKHLTAEEARSILHAGLSIVGLVEGAEKDPLRGRTIGVSHATEAVGMSRDVGAPSSTVLYFSVDWDVQDHEWPNVVDYFRGVATILPHRLIGIYGGANAIRWAKRDGIASWFMQTYGWSHGEWVNGVHIEQYHNGVHTAGGVVDLCRATVPDYGQWASGTPAATNTSGGTVTGAQDVWDFQFSGPSQGVPATAASDWLKYAQSAYAETVALRAIVEAGLARLVQPTTVVDLAPVLAKIQELADLVTAQGDAPMVDAVAVARAITADPTIGRELATAVAGQLATITGQITLSGSLNAGIAPPQL